VGGIWAYGFVARGAKRVIVVGKAESFDESVIVLKLGWCRKYSCRYEEK
jgi:hypothetical protein